MNAVTLVENGFIPTWLVRVGIRNKLKRKLELESNKANKNEFVEMLKKSPIAIATDDANDQHYQVPTEFYTRILGARMKYSACYWPEGVGNLDEAEEASLMLVSERAELKDGMDILELGCGWGSFSLWAAEHYPKSSILAVSNSKTQADYIRARAEERELNNIEVITENMVNFDAPSQFDRIVSIEMFEHMRNYEQLFARVSSWLKNDGKLFVHVFSHKEYAYTYDDSDKSDWMSNYFFTGGVMPSHDLFSHFSNDLKIEDNWQLNGVHYTKTLEAWLKNLDSRYNDILPIFRKHYGKRDTQKWIHRWRIFILACSELFGYQKGSEWGVSHYRFTKNV